MFFLKKILIKTFSTPYIHLKTIFIYHWYAHLDEVSVGLHSKNQRGIIQNPSDVVHSVNQNKDELPGAGYIGAGMVHQ